VSDTRERVLFALLAIPAVVALAWFGGYAWMLFIAAVQVAAIVEYGRLARAKGAAPQRGTMIALSLLLIVVFMHERLAADAVLLFGPLAWPLQWQALLWVLLLGLMLALLVELFRGADAPLLNLGSTLLGVLYIGLFLATTVGIREIFTVVEFPVGRVFGTATLGPAQLAQLERWGGGTMIAVLAGIWLCDTAAYFGGRAMGKHKLFPRVSPKKTWEGAIWGAVAAVAGMLAARAIALDYLGVVDAVLLGLMIGVLGQLGDLVESLLKRDAGVKDSSGMLPGHGGVFDRFDSLIFVSPAVFLYLDFIVFA